ncbi:uncharacterized protein LOC124690105 [Lolium rigidum]|uniref:uncharacterized protein LOC124690105 n=1 Tax=Lolium rigidum TaxID=89674 RepID=UPI001F5E04EA|nr:uncharacterized protein LOC124690105 [Lolium rigidum]
MNIQSSVQFSASKLSAIFLPILVDPSLIASKVVTTMSSMKANMPSSTREEHELTVNINLSTIPTTPLSPPVYPHRSSHQTLAPLHPRAAAPSLFPRPRKRARRKFHRKHRTPPPQHHRRPVVSDHLSPNQGHHELLLITLKLLDTRAQQIEFEIDDKDHFSISAAGRNLVFPAASDLVRHRRGVHQLSGEMAALSPLFPSLFALCLVSPNSDETVAFVLHEFISAMADDRPQRRTRSFLPAFFPVVDHVFSALVASFPFSHLLLPG